MTQTIKPHFVAHINGVDICESNEIDYTKAETIIKSEGIRNLNIDIQKGTIKEIGQNGFQPIEIIKIVLIQFKEFQAKFPCRETALVITKLEEALMWNEARTRDREKRGVEGRSKD